jgi:uroporphyrinogen-III decarboxylase
MNSTSKMSSRERLLAAIEFEEVDQLPFWPKFYGNSYPPSQKAPFNTMDKYEIYRWIGCDIIEWVPMGGCVSQVKKDVDLEIKMIEEEMEITFITSAGSTKLQMAYDAPSQSWHPIIHPIKTLEDIKIMTDFFNGLRYEFSAKNLEKTQEVIDIVGDDGITMEAVGESPLMAFVEYGAGIAQAPLILMDHEEAMDELFDAMQRMYLQKLEVTVEHSAADVLIFVENTSTTMISPTQYRRYCVPHFEQYAEIIKGAGKPFTVHMCGHLKALLGDLDAGPVDIVEAFTSPTIGNTSLLDGREACPDICLMGGTNATLWMQSPDEIIEQIDKDLAELPHHRGLVLSSAGVMTPLCTPETLKTVNQWIADFSPRL